MFTPALSGCWDLPTRSRDARVCDHSWSADDARDFPRLLRSAGLPCLVEYLLDVPHTLLDLAFDLLRHALHLLGLYQSGQRSNLLLNFACHALGSTFYLISIHGSSP
jgi:hypothetical protein